MRPPQEPHEANLMQWIKFHLVTDHKPLEVVFSKKSKPPTRIERWVLRMQKFDYSIKYMPGSENITDAYPDSFVETTSKGVGQRTLRRSMCDS